MDEMDEVLNEFLVESHENLDRLDQALVDLEQHPSPAKLADIFRTIHTIKGTCGFLGFATLESITHVGENLLSLLRDGHLSVTAEITSALLALLDAVRQILREIEATGAEGGGDFSGLVGVLTRLQVRDEPAEAPPASAAPLASEVDAGIEIEVAVDGAPPASAAEVAVDGPPASAVAVDEAPPASAAEAAVDGPPASTAEVEVGRDAEIAVEVDEAPRFGDVLVESGRVSEEAVLEAVAQQAEGDPRHVGEILVERGAIAPHDVADALQAQAERGPSVSDSSIRVDVGLLDTLMNLVGELVLARNQILQFTSTQTDAAFVATSQRLNLITTELQEGVMKTRMQPIGNIWSKFPRVVRDLSVTCGKQVRIEMEGTETELDKTIVEAIKDPLTHLVRNAVDHGIESPEVRVANGKPGEGRLLLRAYHEGGQVNIEIIDDGAGLDIDAIRRRAVERSLVSPDHAARMSDREASQLIFLPGFSTAAKVTNVSGRGVGMDVVKTNIERIGGSVDLQSRPGAGTTLRIRIPLTLAIIPALVVTGGGDRFAIPQISLVELVRLEADQARDGIEVIHGVPVYRLRGSLLPLVHLDRELDLTDGGSEDGAVNIVVLQAEDRTFGLVVDGVHDTEEIVVKPLGKQLKGVSVFAGATIMGDGQVALILDVLGIAQRANVVDEVRDRVLVEARDAAGAREDTQALLLVQAGDGRVAVPLRIVDRLEEFPVSAVERGGGRDVVQYRDRILPLLRVSEALGAERGEDGEVLRVVVYSRGDRRVGLVVDEIVDVVEESLRLEHTNAAGLRGAAVLQQRVTDLLDVEGVVSVFDPMFFADSTDGHELVEVTA